MSLKVHTFMAAGALLLSAAATACGDADSDKSTASAASAAGDGGGDESSAGKGGERAAAGKNAGAGGADKASAGAGGASGSKSDAAAEGGKGGLGGLGGHGGHGGKEASAGAGSKAAAGSGGAAGEAPKAPLPDLSTASARRFEQANALNGVTFGPDGKIYAAGELNVVDDSKATGDTAADKYKTSVVGHKLVVARFNADGSPDESFGDKGFVTWDGPGTDAASMGLALTDDESVVVSVNVKYASKRGGLALLKLDAAGKPVSGFGDAGRKDLLIGWRDEQLADFPKASDGAVQYPTAQSWDIQATDGGKKLVVFAHESAAHGLLDDGAMPAVQRSDTDRYVLRVDAASGELDPSFNGGKPVVVNTPNTGATGMQPRYPSDGSRHGLIEADGSIVSSGYTNYQDDKGNQIVLIRVKADGSFDDAFHKERAGQPVLPGVAVFNPVPEQDKGFAECYGVAHTAKGYVTTGYGKAYGEMQGMSSLGYLASTAVDMVSTRFSGTEVDTSYGRSGVLAAQSEGLGADVVSTFEDRGRSTVLALPDGRILMGGRFGDYPALFVVTDKGELDSKVSGKRDETHGMVLFNGLTSEKQPGVPMIYGLAVAPDGKRVAVGTNNHERGALLAVLEVKDDGSFASVTGK